MIVLSPLQMLEIDLAGAVAATNPNIYVAFFDQNQAGEETKWGYQESSANGTTDATICAAPAPQAMMRCIHTIQIVNLDTSPVVASIQTDVIAGGTNKVFARLTIPASRMAAYEHGSGWDIF